MNNDTTKVSTKIKTTVSSSVFLKTLFSIALPIILQNLLQTFVNMMDTIMVGRLGAVEIAAVGLGNQIFFMLNMVLFGILSGCSIFVSQFWGARNFAGIRKTFGFMLSASIAVAAIFTLGGTLMPSSLISLYSSDESVIAVGAEYLWVAALSYPLMSVSFSCQMAFRSTEHVVLPMVTTAISFVLNVIFNSLFIFGCPLLGIPRLGAQGAAVATVISRFVEMLITVIYSRKKKFEVMEKFSEIFSFTGKFVLNIMKIALPVILSESLWGLGITVQNSIFSHSGTDSFAAFSIMNTVNQLTWIFFIGTGSASAVILGKKIGAGETDSAIDYTHKFCVFMPLMGAIVGLVLIPLSRLLPFIFNVEPSIIGIAQSMMFVLVAMYPFRAFNMLIIVGVCRSGGDTVFSFLIDNGWMWLIAIPLASLATFILKLPAWQIMLCLEIEQILKSVCGIIRVRSGKWLHRVIS